MLLICVGNSWQMFSAELEALGFTSSWQKDDIIGVSGYLYMEVGKGNSICSFKLLVAIVLTLLCVRMHM